MTASNPSLPTPAQLGFAAASGVIPCVIYCRVSSRKQLTDGDGLKGQETNGLRYAEQKGYVVLKVFTDDVTGGIEEREGLDDMLLFIQEINRKTGKEVIVIIDDLKRFARDVIVHFSVKQEIAQHGGRLESPLFRFEDTPEGHFVETIVAAQAELERNQNRRQVLSRMKARLENGYWTFQLPPGYRYQKDPVHKKAIVLDNPRAELVGAALERFAQGLLSGPMEVWRFLAAQGFYGPRPNRAHLSRHLTQIHKMLRQVLYTGHLEFPAWEISLRKGQHPAIISLETYRQIQERLAGKVQKVPRGNVSEVFPLRGLVLCDSCGRPLTGGISRNRHGATYPYYHCGYGGCALRGTTIRPDVIEPAFKHILGGLKASDEVIEVLRLRLIERFTNYEALHAKRSAEVRDELTQVKASLKEVAERLARTKSDVAALALEARIEELTSKSAALEQELASHPKELTAADVRTLFEQARPMLENPLQVWNSKVLDKQKMVTRIAFSTPLRYVRGKGFGTPDIALPYRITRHIATSSSKMVDLEHSAWEQLLVQLREWVKEWEEADQETLDQVPSP